MIQCIIVISTPNLPIMHDQKDRQGRGCSEMSKERWVVGSGDFDGALAVATFGHGIVHCVRDAATDFELGSGVARPSIH
jgi:hypothetical protein